MLSLIGLSLNILGSILLAYDILVGRNLKWKRDRALKGLDNLALSDKILNDQIDRWPEPPFTKKDKEEAKAQLSTKDKQRIEQLNLVIQKYEIDHPENAYTCAFLGVFLLMVGFILQFISEL